MHVHIIMWDDGTFKNVSPDVRVALEKYVDFFLSSIFDAHFFWFGVQQVLCTAFEYDHISINQLYITSWSYWQPQKWSQGIRKQNF